MIIYTSLGHGAVKHDDQIDGTVPCVCEGGAGLIFGEPSGVNTLVGGWDGPRERVDAKGAAAYCARIPRGTLVVSDFFEMRFDRAAVAEVAVFLRIARSMGLRTGHRTSVMRRGPNESRRDWQDKHIAAWKVWRPLLDCACVDLYSVPAGGWIDGQQAKSDSMIWPEVLSTIEAMALAHELNTGGEEVLPVFSPEANGGKEIVGGVKARAYLELFAAFGAKSVAVWTDRGATEQAQKLVATIKAVSEASR